MKLTTRRLLLAACALMLPLAGCQSREREASADALSRPLSTPPPAPSPSIDPRVTDLNRVAVGSVAPDFALPDTKGQSHRLSDFRGRKHVVLVFYRGHF